MIYITGDTHSDFSRFNRSNFSEQKHMTKEDFVIICGDFGGIWDEKESNTETYWLDWLDHKNFTTLFLCGNHENFDRLYTYPIEMWHGGKVHKIRDSVIHLMRGQVYELCGKIFFTFGGAKSHDMEGRILDPAAPGYHLKKKELDRSGLFYRVAHKSWWEQELPSEDEMREGRENLAAYHNHVDYILTHCAPTSVQEQLGRADYGADILTEYLEQIHKECRYRRWFCGHYHKDGVINRRDRVIYEALLRIV